MPLARVTASCFIGRGCFPAVVHTAGPPARGTYHARRALCGPPRSQSHPSPHCPSPRCVSPVTAAAGGAEQAPCQQPPATATISPLSLLHRAGMSPGARGAPFAFPSSGEHHKPHRAAVRMGRIPHVAPGARGSLGPVFPMLSPSSPTQPLGRAVRNHHLIQVHLARHRWGGGGFHPTRCWTAGFLYHLWRQPPVATQNGSEHQGCFPWLGTLSRHHQSWAEPRGERSWLLQDGTACHALLRTQTSFAGFVRDFGKLSSEGLKRQAQSCPQHRTPHDPPFSRQAQHGLPRSCKMTLSSHVWGNIWVCGMHRSSFPTHGPLLLPLNKGRKGPQGRGGGEQTSPARRGYQRRRRPGPGKQLVTPLTDKKWEQNPLPLPGGQDLSQGSPLSTPAREDAKEGLWLLGDVRAAMVPSATPQPAPCSARPAPVLRLPAARTAARASCAARPLGRR